eukprot:COSAG02_NODE_63589_length_263_cov_0.390244_1_plen_49_part_10
MSEQVFDTDASTTSIYTKLNTRSQSELATTSTALETTVASLRTEQSATS